MAFLVKIKELERNIKTSVGLLNEVNRLYKKEGIKEEGLETNLIQASKFLKKTGEDINSFLEDKRAILEKVEFLTAAFRFEYGSVLQYRKISSMIDNKYVARRFKEFAREEISHAKELKKLISQWGGVPQYAFKEKTVYGPPDKENMIKILIEVEKKTIAFYEAGLTKFDSADFTWLLGNIKLEEIEHLNELEKLQDEFQDKEICLKHDPGFKWIAPYMGEPGDRAWIE